MLILVHEYLLARRKYRNGKIRRKQRAIISICRAFSFPPRVQIHLSETFSRRKKNADLTYSGIMLETI